MDHGGVAELGAQDPRPGQFGRRQSFVGKKMAEEIAAGEAGKSFPYCASIGIGDSVMTAMRLRSRDFSSRSASRDRLTNLLFLHIIQSKKRIRRFGL
jgi:hypothetical protein